MGPHWYKVFILRQVLPKFDAVMMIDTKRGVAVDRAMPSMPCLIHPYSRPPEICDPNGFLGLRLPICQGAESQRRGGGRKPTVM